MVRHIGFTATDAIQLSGNNMGYMYAPNTLHYRGPSFDLKAGESLIVVPFQPAGCGPWKVYQSVLKDDVLKTFVKNPKVMCISIKNNWLTKSVRVNRFCGLDSLLCSAGIEHIFQSVSFDDLTEMTDDDEEEDNDDDDDGNASPIPCMCPCCLKVR